MAGSKIHELATRFLSGYGIADCPLDHCSRALTGFRPAAAIGEMRLVEMTDRPERALEYLSLLTWPPTRHVLFSVGSGFTAFVNNSCNGSDYAIDFAVPLARHLQARFARIVCAAGRVWTNGSQREVLQYEARIFELYDHDGENIRTVYAVDDGGHWQFFERGTSAIIESTFPYAARRKRDRFTRDHIQQLAAAFGLPIVTTDTLLSAGTFALFEGPVQARRTCTIEEADDPAHGYYERGLSWVPHMATHADSVIADFERCLTINSAYEEKVRQALTEAYRITGRS